jgi:hypothetical protein
MSTKDPGTFTEWWQNLPLPWLIGGTNGQYEAAANGAVLDGEVANLKAAAKAAMPDFAPADALAHIANDRGIVLGPPSTDTNPALRLRTFRDTYTRAARWVTLLEQLYYGGFNNAVIVQQNGLGFTLSAAPTPGVDPTSLLTITTLGTTTTTLAPVAPSTKTIPAGTPWAYFDGQNDLCDRFAIIFPTGCLCSVVHARATFTATDSATITWNNPNAFQDTSYVVYPGLPVVTDNPAVGVSAWNDGTAMTTTGTTIRASDTFTGYVDVLAAPAGANPFANINAIDLGRLQLIIKTWRPAREVCSGVYVLVQGKFIGWPVRNINSGLYAGSTIGASSTVVYQGA